MATPSQSSAPPAELIPLLRGRLHVYAFWGALIPAAALVALAPSSTARAVCAIYGFALCALFAISALYHRWRWNPRWRPLLRRLDHSTIHIFIAASTTPLAVLVLSGDLQTPSVRLVVVSIRAARHAHLLSVRDRPGVL